RWRQARSASKGCVDPTNPACTNSAEPFVMGYHTGSDLPNYWAYAQNFVLQDHMFEPNASWSLPPHLFMVSGVVCILHAAGQSEQLRQRAAHARATARLQQRTEARLT